MRPVGLFIGRATLDVLGLVDRFPQADDKVTARELVLTAGGPALNAAVTFAHLGGQTTLVSSFGSSVLAKTAMVECAAYGVATIDLAAGRPHAFPISLVIPASEGASRCIVNSPASQSSSGSTPVGPLPATPDIVLIDQFEADAAKQLVPRLRAAGVPIVLDGGSWKPGSPAFLGLATIPIISSRFQPPDCDGPGETVGWLERSAFPQWAITQGPLGVVYRTRCRTMRIEAVAVEAVDTSGAGDIFHGAFCFAHASAQPFSEALRFAAGIAAQSCRFAGPRAWMAENAQT